MYVHMSTISPRTVIVDRGLALHKMIRYDNVIYDDVMHNDVMYDNGSSIRVFGYLLILCGLKASFPPFQQINYLVYKQG